MKRTYYTLLIAALTLTAALAAGCMPEEPPIPKRVSLNFLVQGIGTNDEIVRGDNTMEVTEVKLYLDTFILETNSQARLESTSVGIILQYRPNHSGMDNQLFAGPIGYDDFDTFNGMELFIDPADEGVSVSDEDLMQDGVKYSISIEGNLNGEPFQYLSNASLNRSISFDATTVTADEETLKLRIVTSIYDIFIDPDTDELLSPLDPENSDRINELLESSIQIEASAEASLPFQ